MSAHAQTYSLKGDVEDTVHSAIPFTTISLLQPEDSTLAYFAISNNQGAFELKDVAKGHYLLQIAFMGFRTYYRAIDVPIANNYLGRIVLKSHAKELSEVEVKAEKVPITIHRDTVEYNAGSFKTKPDASVEELLKKLPGVQVDKSGNIKAQGEDVRKVLVDGKEFFSNDPKVATKNLPADAISKVQVFNKHSDASEFTGIDDGSREKTINLQLKDGKKNGYFGDVQAGYGTDDRYKGSAKIYQFKPKTQFAALGMLNNINQFGFSMEDYMNFKGGIQNLMNNSGSMNMNLGDKNAPPVNFGQPIFGLITSGATGVNYTYEPKKNNRINVSYLGNGSEKTLDEQSNTQNFTDQGNFIRNTNKNDLTDNFVHRLNINSRMDKDSVSQFTATAGASLSNGHSHSKAYTESIIKDLVVNSLDSRIQDKGNTASGNASLSYLSNSKNKKQVYKASGNVNYQKDLSNTEWNNITNLIPTSTIVTDMQTQHDISSTIDYNGALSVLKSIGKGYFFEPSVYAGNNIQHFTRRQTLSALSDKMIDSLSPDFMRSYTTLRPGISLSKSSQKIQFNIGIKAEAGMLNRTLNNHDTGKSSFLYFLPSFSLRNEYSTGKSIGFYYMSSANAPEAAQLLPVANYTNPLQVYMGNNGLKPEYAHNIGANWVWFDQFSFSSLFANINGRYTHDKITWARIINPDLTQTVKPVNVAYDYDARGRIEYSRPIRKLGITLNTSLDESYNRGISIINSVDNILNTYNHRFELSIGNKKKDKWDVNIGGSISITDARYSVNKNFNNRYYNTTEFGEISYRPTSRWYVLASADVTNYNAASFSNAVLIPLLKSEISYYFLKANRGTITVEGFDLLNKNTGLQRISQLNYLSEVRSNIIGRYFMLSFKYRISKTGGGSSNKISIKMN